MYGHPCKEVLAFWRQTHTQPKVLQSVFCPPTIQFSLKRGFKLREGEALSFCEAVAGIVTFVKQKPCVTQCYRRTKTRHVVILFLTVVYIPKAALYFVFCPWVMWHCSVFLSMNLPCLKYFKWIPASCRHQLQLLP